jgi:hypothetical protein
MTNLPKRTIGELVFYYTKASRQKGSDIFVEGAGDKLLLDNYIKSREVDASPVYTMDMIDFSGVDFSGLGLSAPSARSSVIALRKILKDEEVDVDRHLFIIDRDTEDLCETPLIEGIELTDSGALPVHLYDNLVERKFADLIFSQQISSRLLKLSVNSVCTDVYLLKVASQSLGLGVRALPVGDFVNGSRVDGFTLDFRAYVERCLYACGAADRLDEVMAHTEVSRSRISAKSLRNFALINDHTLWDVLKSIGARVSASNNRSVKDIEEMVRMTFDPDQLSEHRLFQAIEQRVSEGRV